MVCRNLWCQAPRIANLGRRRGGSRLKRCFTTLEPCHVSPHRKGCSEQIDTIPVPYYHALFTSCSSEQSAENIHHVIRGFVKGFNWQADRTTVPRGVRVLGRHRRRSRYGHGGVTRNTTPLSEAKQGNEVLDCLQDKACSSGAEKSKTDNKR